jgi:hypothetical protein
MINPMQDKEILNGLSAITGWVQTWAVPLAAIGTVSMAFLQTAKNVFPLRNWFQRFYFHRWLRASAKKASKCKGLCAGAEKAEKDLIALATSGDANAFYDLPIEQLCGQIKEAVPVILDYPQLHVDLLRCLSSEANCSDMYLIFEPPAPAIFLKRGDQTTEDEKRAIREYAAAKTRLGTQVRCSVDAIQTSIGFRWKYCLQVASVILSSLLGIVALHMGAGPDHAYPTISSTIMIGVLSGFLAPVARDLVAAIEKWRN